MEVIYIFNKGSGSGRKNVCLEKLNDSIGLLRLPEISNEIFAGDPLAPLVVE